MPRALMILAALCASASCGGQNRSELSPPAAAPEEAALRAPDQVEAPSAPRITPFDGGAALLEAEGLRGTFVVRGTGEEAFRVAFAELAAEGYSPASTFKIPNALIALETGAVPAEGLTLPWDGEERAYAGWNRDHDLPSAMEGSVVWYFQEVARRIGREQMADWVARLDYGNGQIGAEVDTFWLDGPLRISPLEQVAFVERLLSSELPVSDRSAAEVRRIIPTRAAGDEVLHAKTGTHLDEERCHGWLVGWVERHGRVTASFALLLLGDAEEVSAIQAARWDTAADLLERGGYVTASDGGD